jgi:hypothetical protein
MHSTPKGTGTRAQEPTAHEIFRGTFGTPKKFSRSKQFREQFAYSRTMTRARAHVFLTKLVAYGTRLA